MFGLDDHKAACSRLDCFKNKTNEWLETRKAELTEQYGTVLLVQQVSESDRNTVDALSVGKEQFETGCMGCEKRTALIDDRLGRSLGTTYESQCIDAICYSNCTKALADSMTAIEVTPEQEAQTSSSQGATDSNIETTTTKPKKSKNAKKSTKVKCNVSSKIIETNKSLLRKVSAGLLMPEPHFQSAMTYAALRKIATGYKPLAPELSSTAHFSEVINSAMSLDEVTLMAEIANVTLHLSSNQASEGLNFTDIMISLMPHADNAKETAIAKWMPTKEILNQYTNDGIRVLCKQSGFEAAFDVASSDELAKIATKGKGKLIEAVLKFDFDWTYFAPKEFVALIK